MYTPTPDQLTSYDQNGYILLRVSDHGLVDPSTLQQWTQQVKSWPLPEEKGKWMPYNEVNVKGEKQLMRTERFVDYHPEFKKLVCGSELGEILREISGEEMTLFKDKINYKQPHGNGFQAHLDAPAYNHIGHISHLTANFAIDAATPENGCLEVVPGSHRMQVDLADGGRISPAWEAAQEWVSIPMEAGDVLFFGSHLAHRSAVNLTERSRASLYATFYSKTEGVDLREEYYKHRMVMFPPDHQREEGKDYAQGYKIYGFAAPFSKDHGITL